MYPARRIDALVAMIKLRRLAGLMPGLDDRQFHDTALSMMREECAETRILEIVELAHVLTADDLAATEVLTRIGSVHGPFPPEFSEKLTLERDWLTYILEREEPDYLKDGRLLLDEAIAIASLWATYHAVTLGGWPTEDMLSAPWEIMGNAGLIRSGDADNIEWPQFTGTLDDLDILLKEYGRSGLAVDVRRMKARANPGDTLCGFSTGRLSWAIMGGRSGIAHVRDGQCIDHFVTMMN